jgi:hypothetical protein
VIPPKGRSTSYGSHSRARRRSQYSGWRRHRTASAASQPPPIVIDGGISVRQSSERLVKTAGWSPNPSRWHRGPIGRSRQPSLLPDPRPDASRVDARLTHAGTLSRGRFSIHVDGFLSRWPIGATREMFRNTHRCFCTCGDSRCTARLHWLFGRRLRAATGTVFAFGRSHENSDTAP